MIYRVADLVIDAEPELPELDRAEGLAEVRVGGVDPGRLAAPQWFHAWPTPDGGVWLRFGRAADGVHLEFPEFGTFVISLDAAHVGIAPHVGAPAETMRHLLLNQVLPIVLSRRGRLVVHGSAISIDGSATAIVGATGAGKSTLAAAACQRGAELLTDDAIVLTPCADGWRVVPSYSGLRLWPESLGVLGWSGGRRLPQYSRKLCFSPADGRFAFAPAPVRLARCLVLENDRSGRVEITPMTGHRAVIALATHLFRLDAEDSDESVRLFDALSRAVAGVEILRVNASRPAEALGPEIASGCKPPARVVR